METAQQQVESLIADMKDAAVRGDMTAFDRKSDELAVLTMAHVTPSEPINWDSEGIYISSKYKRRMLNTLFAHPGRIFSDQSLMDAMYFDRGAGEPGDKIVNVYVCHIRKKLAGSKFQIETVHGRGYKGVISQPEKDTP